MFFFREYKRCFSTTYLLDIKCSSKELLCSSVITWIIIQLFPMFEKTTYSLFS